MVHLGHYAWAFIASPLRAIADAIYLDKEITWKRDGLGYLTDSLRIEEDDLAGLSFESVEEILESFRSRRVRPSSRDCKEPSAMLNKVLRAKLLEYAPRRPRLNGRTYCRSSCNTMGLYQQ